MNGYLLAGALLAASTNAVAASPPFDARIEAKQTDDGIEITAIIANHSHHSACFMAVNQGSFSLHYKDGTSSFGAVNSEPSDDSPAALIQLVPADDRPYRYFWLKISPAPVDPSRYPISVETQVTLIDCGAFFADAGSDQREVFSATQSAPIGH